MNLTQSFIVTGSSSAGFQSRFHPSDSNSFIKIEHVASRVETWSINKTVKAGFQLLDKLFDFTRSLNRYVIQSLHVHLSTIIISALLTVVALLNYCYLTVIGCSGRDESMNQCNWWWRHLLLFQITNQSQDQKERGRGGGIRDACQSARQQEVVTEE